MKEKFYNMNENWKYSDQLWGKEWYELFQTNLYSCSNDEILKFISYDNRDMPSYLSDWNHLRKKEESSHFIPFLWASKTRQYLTF